MTTEHQVLNFAESLLALDIHEDPPRSNCAPPITVWASRYGYSYGDAWCSWTISYIIDNVDPALCDGTYSGASVSWLNWGKHVGRVIPNPVPGAIDIQDHDDDPLWTDHVGLVRNVNADGSWYNYEGNHADRYGVVKRDRSDARHYFVLPKYSEKPSKKKDEPGEDKMEIVEVGKQKRFPAYNDGGLANCGFDITDESSGGTGARIRLFFRRNDGDHGYAPQSFAEKWTKDIMPDSSMFVDVAKDFKVVGYITVKVECLSGGPVGVTRRQVL